MKKILLFLILLLIPVVSFAQGYNSEKTALTKFLVRMYDNAPFEGVKVVDDYDHRYLLSVISISGEKYPSESVLNRVASVKAMSQASRYFNGSYTAADLIIRTTEKAGATDTEIIETIKERSVGYVKSLELLTSFDNKTGNKVFMYIKQFDDDPVSSAVSPGIRKR